MGTEARQDHVLSKLEGLLFLLSCFRFGQPSSAQLFGRDIRQIRLDIEDWRSVEHVHSTSMEARSISSQQFDNTQPNGIWPARRASREHSVRAVVRWRVCKQVEALDAIKYPKDNDVREPVDIGESRFELRQNFKNPFGFVLCTQAFRHLVTLAVRAANVSDGLWREHD
jgi:hypothetical protein